MAASEQLGASFRDPSGFVFRREGVLYRQVNTLYREEYEHLMRSGLYPALVDDGLLIPHAEIGLDAAPAPDAYQVIRPDEVAFVSYPYEWCFSGWREAALATLAVQRKALSCGMSLKDASAYNIQFHRGKPLLIDTLSFERYREGVPWVAYRQFCRHFLAPLALMCRTDVRLGQLLQVHLDGVPLDLAGRLLGPRTWLSFPLLCHIHLHSASQGGGSGNSGSRQVPLRALLGLLDSLEGAIRGMRWAPRGSRWAGYYRDAAYADQARRHKEEFVAGCLRALPPGTLWDLGANTGPFSRLAASLGFETVAMDSDAASVEQCYQECARVGEKCVLPLVMDLTNPTPAIGWAHGERMSLAERGPADVALALALVHHLAIGNNVPLPAVAAFMRRVARALVIEFVPKTDKQVREMLQTRDDIFPEYHQAGFERAFETCFRIERREQIRGTERWAYLMYAKEG